MNFQHINENKTNKQKKPCNQGILAAKKVFISTVSHKFCHTLGSMVGWLIFLHKFQEGHTVPIKKH